MSYDGPITIMCCLFDSTEVWPSSRKTYTTEWVNKLYRGFNRNLERPFRFVCITDLDGTWEPAIERVPFELERRNYFSILEAFRPDLVDGRVLLTGLDTVITGSMEDICGYEGTFGLIRNVPIEELLDVWQKFYPRIRFGNGVVMYGPEAADHLWRTFVANPKHWYDTTAMPGHTYGSEMVFMCEQAPCEPDALCELYPGQIVGFRRTARHEIGDARLVWFAGSTKPHQSRWRTNPVIKDHWC